MTTDAPIDIGSLITSTPDIHGGAPCIAGTRVPVHEIAIMHRDGASVQEIGEQFRVPVGHVHAAVAYYLVNRERIEAELADSDALHAQMMQGDLPPRF